MTPRRRPASAAPLAIARANVADLKPAPFNPRRIRPERMEALKASLAADPAMLEARPLVALPDGTVLMGNMRLRAAVELGWETIPVVFADLSEEQARVWMLRDNQEFGEWDEPMVAEILKGLASSGVELALTGFESRDIDRLLAGVAAPQGAPDPDDAPAPPDEPRSRPGEVYELGPHRLMCGDSTDMGQVGELMAGELAGLVFTDPPYGVDYTGGSKPQRALANDHAGTSIYHDALPAAFAVSEDDAPLYLWHAGMRSRDVLAACEASGWEPIALIIWAKNLAQFGAVGAHYKQKHEPCLYARKKGKRARWFGPANETTIWEQARAAANEYHPTQKPVELAERALRNSSERGDVVLDLFGGSGSTLIAAEQTGRRARLMEIDPAYCDVIRVRYERLMGGEAAA